MSFEIVTDFDWCWSIWSKCASFFFVVLFCIRMYDLAFVVAIGDRSISFQCIVSAFGLIESSRMKMRLVKLSTLESPRWLFLCFFINQLMNKQFMIKPIKLNCITFAIYNLFNRILCAIGSFVSILMHRAHSVCSSINKSRFEPGEMYTSPSLWKA